MSEEERKSRVVVGASGKVYGASYEGIGKREIARLFKVVSDGAKGIGRLPVVYLKAEDYDDSLVVLRLVDFWKVIKKAAGGSE